MSLITYNGLLDLVEQGVITNVNPAHINAASIDVTLGESFWVEMPPKETDLIDLAAKQGPLLKRMDVDAFCLTPHQFCLAATREIFNLPDYIAAEFRLKSSGARAGLNASLAMWCDPGWTNSVLTLELSNILSYHTLILRPGMKIGQMIFMYGEAVPEKASYSVRGRYNGDLHASPSKGTQ